MNPLTINPDRIAAITLKAGKHDNIDQGACLMEAVAYLAGEQFSDRPTCVSPVLGIFGRGLNDCLPDDRRQALVALIPSLLDTASDGLDEARSFMALDWRIRTWLPMWLDLSPTCHADAAKVRGLGRIVDLVSAERAGPVVRQAKETSTAAWTAAGATAVWDAAGDAVWDAAVDTAGAAARDAALATAGAATGAVALAAAGAAALAAALAAAAANASDHTKAALQPTVDALQLSAIDLYADMIKAPW